MDVVDLLAEAFLQLSISYFTRRYLTVDNRNSRNNPFIVDNKQVRESERQAYNTWNTSLHQYNVEPDYAFARNCNVTELSQVNYTHNYNYKHNTVHSNFGGYESFYSERRKVSTPITVKYNSNMIKDLLRYSGSAQFNSFAADSNINPSFEILSIIPHSSEYQYVINAFNHKMRRKFRVREILKLENPFLYLQFHLKKLQKEITGLNVETHSLFHGTSECNVYPICLENFNWRFHGTSVGHRFGHGVSFAPKSFYASYYPRNNVEIPRVMFLAQVLISRKCHGNRNMVIPPDGYDTSIKPDGNVIVKYEDHEFYPMYLIYYA